MVDNLMLEVSNDGIGLFNPSSLNSSSDRWDIIVIGLGWVGLLDWIELN